MEIIVVSGTIEIRYSIFHPTRLALSKEGKFATSVEVTCKVLTMRSCDKRLAGY